MEVRRLMARVFTILIPAQVSGAAYNRKIQRRIDIKMQHSTEGVKCSS